MSVILLNDKLFKQLAIIPISVIITSVFITGVNLVKRYENSYDFVEEEDKEFLEYTGKDENVTFLLDINTASFMDLRTLPGIGDTMAERIVEYRFDAGGFKELKELLLLDGMNSKKYEELLPYITIE